MFFVVAGVLVAVIYLAGRQAPSSPSSGALPPATEIPATGASPIQSPATTGINPLVSSAARITLEANTGLSPTPRGSTRRQIVVPPGVPWNQQDFDSKRLMTQKPFPETPNANTPKIGPKL